jgi:type IV secretion system protein VirD4
MLFNAGDTDKAEMLAWDLTNNLVGKPEGEKDLDQW